MVAVKKAVLLAVALLISTFGANAGEPERKITAAQRERAQESEEVERKEQFTRDPQGRVVPFTQSGDVERKGAAARRVGRPATFGEATRRLAPGSVSPFAQAVAARARTPLAQRIGELPIDAQTNIARYAEEDKYDLWKTLNITAYKLAFRDNGENLVTINKWIIRREEPLMVIVRNMESGTIIQQFFLSLPSGESVISRILLSGDGTTIVGKNKNGTRIYIWDTTTASLKTSIDRSDMPISGSLQAIAHNGELLVGQMTIRENVLINLQTGNSFSLINEDEVPIFFSISPDNKTVFASLSDSIGFWNAENGAYKYGLKLKDKWGDVAGIVSNNNATLIALMTRYNKIILFHNDDSGPDGFKIVRKINVPASYRLNSINGIELSHDSKKIAIIGREIHEGWGVGLWDVTTGNYMQQLDLSMSHDAYIRFAFSPDDKILAITTYENGIKLWKKSTALQDALAKQQRIEELRSGTTGSMPSSSSSSSSTTIQEPSALSIHVQPAAEVSGAPTIDMEQPD